MEAKISKQIRLRGHVLTARSGILISWWVSCICCCRPCFYTYLHAVCELTCSNDFRDKQGVLKLMVGARCPSCIIYRVKWYLRLLALSILTCSPNMSFLARLIFAIPEV